MIFRFLISPRAEKKDTGNSLKTQWEKAKKIWNGETCKSIGIERLVRVFLVFQAFLFPGIYFRYLFGSSSNTAKKLAIEAYVCLKCLLGFLILFGVLNFNKRFNSCIAGYLIGETIFYVLSVIFLEDIHKKPQSFSRSLLLIFINYFEITIWFAVLYLNFGLEKNKIIVSPLKALYFSLTTATTVGYGDITPNNDSCMIIGMLQMVIMLIFIVLFFNKFVGSINEEKSKKQGIE